jgi:hypothetical protein
MNFTKVYSKQRGIHHISDDVDGWIFLIIESKRGGFNLFSSEGERRQNLRKVGNFNDIGSAKRFAIKTIGV